MAKPVLPRKPVVEVISSDAHHNRFGAAPIHGLGSPDDGAAFVVIFRQVIRNGKLAWKKMGEARFHRHHGLHAQPYGLPASAADALAEHLRAFPDTAWK
jgi:hypothetical protein